MGLLEQLREEGGYSHHSLEAQAADHIVDLMTQNLELTEKSKMAGPPDKTYRYNVEEGEKMCAGASPRMEKHITLWQEIENIHSVIRRLEELIERIHGPTPPEDSNAVKENIPTLSVVLNEGPAKISRLIERAQKNISELEEILF